MFSKINPFIIIILPPKNKMFTPPPPNLFFPNPIFQFYFREISYLRIGRRNNKKGAKVSLLSISYFLLQKRVRTSGLPFMYSVLAQCVFYDLSIKNAWLAQCVIFYDIFPHVAFVYVDVWCGGIKGKSLHV